MEKIIGVGFHKTGTTSLGKALRTLGYRCTGWCEETAAIYKHGHQDALLDMMADFDAFEDVPWFLLYREAHARYGNDLRFILTLRQDMDIWFASLSKHIDRIKPDPFSFRELIYGTNDLESVREHVIATHRRHIETVRSFTAQTGTPLLEVCWETGDGWTELCEFLGKHVPNQPFPHVNRKPVETPRTALRYIESKIRTVITR